jgi:hypothetical protein
MRLTITLAAAAALLATGASPAAVAETTKPKSDRNQCFYTRNADSFAAPNDKTLYVRVGVRDIYRFDMFGPCQDIDWNQRLALVARGGSDWICDAMDAEVISRAQGLGRQRCLVRHMRKLTPQEVAALPKDARP